MKKIILKILMTSLCVSALIGILIILFGDFGSTEGKVLATTALIFGYAIPGFCASTIYEKKKLRAFSIMGMLMALATCVFVVSLVWRGFGTYLFETVTWRIFATLNILCWSCGHIALMLLVDSRAQAVSIARIVTIGVAVISDVLMLVSVFGVELPELVGRLMLVLGILLVLGTIGTPILNKIYKKSGGAGKELGNT